MYSQRNNKVNEQWTRNFFLVLFKIEGSLRNYREMRRKFEKKSVILI